MTPGDMLSSDQLNILYEIAEKFNVDPKLILAIGWHETQWGRLGDGKKGMVLGYGSFDSGSDYSYAGFEKQVTGVAQKLKSWGMTPGAVSLSRLELGNKGLLPSGIYATDSNWPNAVWTVYKNLETTPPVIAASVIPNGSSWWSGSITEKINQILGKNSGEITTETGTAPPIAETGKMTGVDSGGIIRILFIIIIVVVMIIAGFKMIGLNPVKGVKF